MVFYLLSESSPISVGHMVPAFELDTYDPAAADFGKFSFDPASKSGRWTVLVFYPADFTFVCQPNWPTSRWCRSR